MLARVNRVKTPDDFRRILRRGRRLGGDLLVAHTLRTEQEPSRFGFVVGRAVGNAVVRNTVRRRLRAIARELLPGLEDGTAVVVRALPPAASGSSRQLGEELERALRRAKVLD